jgi:hypothetical protein
MKFTLNRSFLLRGRLSDYEKLKKMYAEKTLKWFFDFAYFRYNRQLFPNFFGKKFQKATGFIVLDQVTGRPAGNLVSF